LPSRIAGTIFPGVAEPLTGVVAVLGFEEVFAELLPVSDFFVIAIVKLLSISILRLVYQRAAAEALLRAGRGVRVPLGALLSSLLRAAFSPAALQEPSSPA
jgi:hypothetical protein